MMGVLQIAKKPIHHRIRYGGFILAIFASVACTSPKTETTVTCDCSDQIQDLEQRLRKEITREIQRAQTTTTTTPDERAAYPDPDPAPPENDELTDQQRAQVRALASEECSKLFSPKLAKQHNRIVDRDPDGLKVNTHVIAAQIDMRLPLGVDNTFDVGVASVYCYVEIANVYQPDRELTLRWVHSSGVTQTYQLNIGQSPAWRTWSKLNLTRAMVGLWQCEIYNESGTMLSTIPFKITKNPPPDNDGFTGQ